MKVKKKTNYYNIVYSVTYLTKCKKNLNVVCSLDVTPHICKLTNFSGGTKTVLKTKLHNNKKTCSDII